ncbi:MAG TPA: DinB family protein [Thermoanaerobaculia bacterium]
MRRRLPCRLLFLAVLILAAAVPAAAHHAPGHGAQPAQAPAAEAPAAEPPAAAVPAAAGFQNDVAADLVRTGEKLVGLAEAIPADRYGWRPAEGVRSVSEALVHVLNANLLLPPALGAAPPEGVALPQDMPAVMAWMREREATMTAKEAVVGELRRSIDYAAAALRDLDTASLEETIQPLGFPASRRAYALVLLTHNHEHLGQAIAYARSLGVTPPWSEAPAPEAAAEGGESDYD